MRVSFTMEERLVLENINLKIQLAEARRALATQQLAGYTEKLLAKYEVPKGTEFTVDELGITVSEPSAEGPTPEGT